jgi:hypothetical protein
VGVVDDKIQITTTLICHVKSESKSKLHYDRSWYLAQSGTVDQSLLSP